MEHKAVEGEIREYEDDSVIDPAQLPISPPRLLEVTSPTGNKKSPLVYFKKRVTKSSKKRRESGGQSSDTEQPEASATSPSNVSDAKEKPQRKGIAKVFHDLRFRRARKTSPMESTPIQTSLDDDSYSSYATPAEALSSGYSTPMYESTVGSPEVSLSQAESFVEQDEEGDVTTIPHDQSQGQDANGYPKNEHLYKVLVIGELGTGKTSIIKRYVHQFFSQHYRATIGVDFALKVVHWDQSTVIRLQLWDIAGQERFGNMTRVYYKEAVGAFIVFDVTRQSTFESVAKWKQDLDTKVQLPDGSPIPCVLLANKCDQPKEGIAANPAKMDEYCKEKGFAGWYETSAKDNINIDDAAKFLVGTNDQWSTNVPEEDPDRLDLNGKGAPGEQKKSACC